MYEIKREHSSDAVDTVHEFSVETKRYWVSGEIPSCQRVAMDMEMKRSIIVNYVKRLYHCYSAMRNIKSNPISNQIIRSFLPVPSQ